MDFGIVDRNVKGATDNFWVRHRPPQLLTGCLPNPEGGGRLSKKAFKNGAFDFLLKPFSREAFLSTVARAIEQDANAMQELIRKSQLSEALKTLSPRERQVFELLAKGYGNKELVDELGISLPTVKEYKSEVMYKLRLRSLAELIALNTSLLHS